MKTLSAKVVKANELDEDLNESYWLELDGTFYLYTEHRDEAMFVTEGVAGRPITKYTKSKATLDALKDAIADYRESTY